MHSSIEWRSRARERAVLAQFVASRASACARDNDVAVNLHTSPSPPQTHMHTVASTASHARALCPFCTACAVVVAFVVVVVVVVNIYYRSLKATNAASQLSMCVGFT